jgi:hypothetical protein
MERVTIDWTDDLARIDWTELGALYRAAPLGDKAPAHLELVFGNSMFRTFAFDGSRLAGAGHALGAGTTTPISAISQCTRRTRLKVWARMSSPGCCASQVTTGRSFFMQCRQGSLLQAVRLSSHEDCHGWRFRRPCRYPLCLKVLSGGGCVPPWGCGNLPPSEECGTFPPSVGIATRLATCARLGDAGFIKY